MARISGVDGSVTIGTATKGLSSWNIDVDIELPDVTGFDSAGWRQFVGGLKQWSGSCAASYDTDAVGSGALFDLFGTITTGTFTMTTGVTFSGSVLIKKVNVQNDVTGKPEISIDFQGSGTLTTP